MVNTLQVEDVRVAKIKSENLQKYCEDHGINGRVTHSPPHWKIRLWGGKDEGSLKTEIQSDAEPSLYAFFLSLVEHRAAPKFFTEGELRELKDILCRT